MGDKKIFTFLGYFFGKRIEIFDCLRYNVIVEYKEWGTRGLRLERLSNFSVVFLRKVVEKT